ncbi:MAG: response regulator [Desulfobacterales bacterium]|nr:response regulator [Desulfobacterales bacterium]
MKRILVIDDEKDLLSLLAEHFESIGWEVDLAQDGAQGMALLSGQEFDVILTDIRMPETSGTDILRASEESHPDTQVIMMTGYKDIDKAIESLNLGAYGYLGKPFPLAEVEHKVVQAYEKRRLVQKEREYQADLERLVREKAGKLYQHGRLLSLAEMAAGVAHELSQPLNAISTFAEGMLIRIERGMKIDEKKIASTLKEILAQIERMGEIVNHMRAFARDFEKLPDQKMAAEEIIEESLRLVGAQLRHQEIMVSVKVEPPDLCFLANKYKLQQVLLNLIYNARDAVNEKEETIIKINGNLRPYAGWHKQIEIEAFQVKNGNRPYHVIEVRDNGIGIPEDNMENLFQPFFTTKETGKGTGLGLSTSYGIVNKYGGRIEVESTYGEGAVFRILLPVYAD